MMESADTMAKLLAPYPNWTADGQIRWLRKRGYSAKTIDAAMTELYRRMADGESFESGDALDQALLRIAADHDGRDIKEYIEAANLLKKNLSAGKAKKLWMVLTGEL